MVPAAAIGNPIAAAVPIACSSGRLHQTMNGTVRKAPPTAAKAEIPLIAAPTANRPSGTGQRARRVGLALEEQVQRRRVDGRDEDRGKGEPW